MDGVEHETVYKSTAILSAEQMKEWKKYFFFFNAAASAAS